MPLRAPFTYYACPCDSDTSADPRENALERTNPTSRQSISPVKRLTSTFQRRDSEERENAPFNPHDPRATYSLYSLDDLLFCDECNHIRCPKCWQEEIMSWYCPQCLFEVPSSVVRADGNRCARSCYNCPVCTATLVIASHEQQQTPGDGDDDGNDGLLKPPGVDTAASSKDSYILQCGYCCWSSLDIGLQFPRPTKITEQLNNIRKARLAPPRRQREMHGEEVQDETAVEPPEEHHTLDPDTAFKSLSKFYKEQLEDGGDGQNHYGTSPYSSPANLARIMSLYGGLSYNALKKSREKPLPMHEAQKQSEGLRTYRAGEESAEKDVLNKLQQLGWEETASIKQRRSAPQNFNVKFVDELWPVATPLRLRRGKRCTTCRQFISRPEPKVSSFRYKIRLLAQNHIPRLAFKPLNPKSAPFANPSFKLKPGTQEEVMLQPHVVQQYILTLRNPIFETVRVTLATPATTPGRVASRVTILCPTFTLGPAGDVWDEALSNPTGPQINDGGRHAAMASLTGSADGGDRQPEAGKVWEKTRSSTSVILEVIPGATTPTSSIINKAENGEDKQEPTDGDDVLAIPIFVRAEWEAESQAEGQAGGKGERETRELAYWCVLTIGKVAG